MTAARRRASAFTLLELLIVIVVLALLGVAALPRFFDADTEAHEATVKATGSAFATAVQMVHAQWRLAGAVPNLDNVPGFGDGTVDVNAQGWPTDTAGFNSIPTGTAGRNRCRRLLETLLLYGPTVSRNWPATPGLISPATAGGGAPPYDPEVDYWASAPVVNRCQYDYQPLPNLGFSYDCATGTVTIDDDSSS